MHPFIGISVAAWSVGVFGNLLFRLDGCGDEDVHTATGKSLLWPLLVLRFVGVALYRAGAALFTLA